MNVLLIVAHPNPDSFNQALVKAAKSALETTDAHVKVKDLYAEKFNPVFAVEELNPDTPLCEDIVREQTDIEWADRLVFFYPMWWYDRPAILKGWCDRVLTHGFAFQASATGIDGLLGGKKAAVYVTTGASQTEFKDLDMKPENLLNMMTKGSLGYCGIKNVQAQIFFAISRATPEERANMLNTVKTEVIDLCT